MRSAKSDPLERRTARHSNKGACTVASSLCLYSPSDALTAAGFLLSSMIRHQILSASCTVAASTSGMTSGAFQRAPLVTAHCRLCIRIRGSDQDSCASSNYSAEPCWCSAHLQLAALGFLLASEPVPGAATLVGRLQHL